MANLTTHHSRLLNKSGALGVNTSCCCVPPPPPPPPQDCQRCITIFRGRSNNQSLGCAKNDVYTLDINIPASYSFPLTVRITGGVDDDLKVNGTLIEENEYVSALYPDCNPAHCIGSVNGWPYGYTTSISSSPLTLTLVDNYGYGKTLDVTVCLDPDNEQGKYDCPTVTNISDDGGLWNIGTDPCCVAPDCNEPDIDACRCNPFP